MERRHDRSPCDALLYHCLVVHGHVHRVEKRARHPVDNCRRDDTVRRAHGHDDEPEQWHSRNRHGARVMANTAPAEMNISTRPISPSERLAFRPSAGRFAPQLPIPRPPARKSADSAARRPIIIFALKVQPHAAAPARGCAVRIPPAPHAKSGHLRLQFRFLRPRAPTGLRHRPGAAYRNRH